MAIKQKQIERHKDGLVFIWKYKNVAFGRLREFFVSVGFNVWREIKLCKRKMEPQIRNEEPIHTYCIHLHKLKKISTQKVREVFLQNVCLLGIRCYHSHS